MNKLVCRCGRVIDIDKSGRTATCTVCGEKWFFVRSWGRWAKSSELEEKIYCMGLTNILNGNLRFLQLDYDTKDWSIIAEDLSKLTTRWDINSFIIMSTKNGYHVISPEVFAKTTITKILSVTNCDPDFIFKQKTKSYTTLRISPKYEKHNGKLFKISPEPELYSSTILIPNKRRICLDVIKFYELLTKQQLLSYRLPDKVVYRSKLQFVMYKTLKP